MLFTEEWQKVSSKNTEGPTQPCWLKEATPSSLILNINHFCDYGASASLESTRQIRLYMQPCQITDDTKTVNVFAYAVQKSFLDVSSSL